MKKPIPNIQIGWEAGKPLEDERRTSNIEHRTSNEKQKTNTEHSNRRGGREARKHKKVITEKLEGLELARRQSGGAGKPGSREIPEIGLKYTFGREKFFYKTF